MEVMLEDPWGRPVYSPEQNILRAPREIFPVLTSALDIEPDGSAATTNSGWMVVEWMPSLWKNSLTFSATWE